MKISFLKYKTNQIVRNSRNIHVSVPYKQARTVGLIFTVEDKLKHNAIKDFVKRLEGEGKDVQVLEYLPKEKDNFEFRYDFFTEKDVNFWGNINSTPALSFADAPFDFLFYLDLEPNPFVSHILAKSKAKCRVGIYWEKGPSYLDLMIQSAANIRALVDSMHKYVSNIK